MGYVHPQPQFRPVAIPRPEFGQGNFTQVWKHQRVPMTRVVLRAAGSLLGSVIRPEHRSVEVVGRLVAPRGGAASPPR